MNKANVEECLRRAELMNARATIMTSPDEEAAIIFKFYSAYHTVKAAFAGDPIFDSVSRLSAKDSNLVLEDRYAVSHVGRNVRGGHRLGVNDIVRILYPHVAGVYWALHQASIDVRYEGGLRVMTIGEVDSRWRTVLDAYQAGALKAE